MSKKELSTEHYKGVRDFYPQEQFLQRYIFEAMSRACEKYGYEEYHASILEPAELYRGKSSEEIVNEQTYTFEDRGGREVTLRPEMTPTVTRMVAAQRRELVYPLRWYSIPNCFRYERPQRGRLREHWQLNADIFGVPGIEAEAEIIALASAIMRELGASEDDFEIHINDRQLLEALLAPLSLAPDEHKALMRVLDARDKLDDFEGGLREILGAERTTGFLAEFNRTSANAHLADLQARLNTLGVSNVVIDTGIVRGFDYYTGMVFEVFDANSENRRSLFGGGRYDNLLSLFGAEPLPAVGFGMGDVTARDFLEAHNLVPEYTPATELMLCVLDAQYAGHAMELAEKLRNEDVTVAVNYSYKRAGDQIRQADKLAVPFVICIGEREAAEGRYAIKHMPTGDERIVPAERIAEHMFSAQG